MEIDMSAGSPEVRKEDLRSRWHQNETDCLRKQCRKVDVSAFIKLRPSVTVSMLLDRPIVRKHTSYRMPGAFGSFLL